MGGTISLPPNLLSSPFVQLVMPAGPILFLQGYQKVCVEIGILLSLPGLSLLTDR